MKGRAGWLNRRVRTVAALATVVVAGESCNHVTAPRSADGSPFTIAPFESIPYDAIGTGRVMFQRYGTSDSVTGVSARSGVYIIDADARRSFAVLDTVGGIVFGPAISPSGTEILRLAWSGISSCYQVFATDLTGANQRQLSRTTCNAVGPASWSPSGASAVYLVFEAAGRGPWGVFESPLASTIPIQLRKFTLTPNGFYGCPGALRDLAFGGPSLSDASGLTYICGLRDPGELIVARTPADSLTSYYKSAAASAELYSPVWSQDGKKIAFVEAQYTASRVMARTIVRVLDVATRGIQTVATIDGDGGGLYYTANALSVCWVGGGTKLVFNAPATGTTDGKRARASVYVVGVDGAGLVRLTTAVGAHDHSVSCTR